MNYICKETDINGRTYSDGHRRAQTHRQSRQIDRDRQRDRETDRQTDRTGQDRTGQTDTQTDKYTDGQTESDRQTFQLWCSALIPSNNTVLFKDKPSRAYNISTE